MHLLPTVQAALAPQRQRPSAPQASACLPQSTHAEPPTPHRLSVRASQCIASLQHPDGQLAASHAEPVAVQAPPEQLVLLPQAGLVPQRQFPAGEQLSAFARLQAVQMPPPVPQKPTSATLHTPVAQQPFGQDVTLHITGMQLPLMHLLPTVQAALAPQRQAPALEQESAVNGSQAAHPAPAAPHDVMVLAVVHVEPVQHPFEQFAAVHGLVTHVLLTHC